MQSSSKSAPTSSIANPTLLLGASSIIGFNLALKLQYQCVPYIPPQATMTATNRRKLNWKKQHLEDESWIARQFQQYTPSTIIYAHAVCDVSKCQKHPTWAHELNVEHLKRFLKFIPPKTRLAYISSDHVFGHDGTYTESSPPCPISEYGQTRVQSEQIASQHPNTIIIRPGLPIGPSPNKRTGHYDWLHSRHKRKLPITIIKDEARSAVCVQDLVERILQLTESDFTGIAHIPAVQCIDRVSLAKHIMKTSDIHPEFKIETREQQPAPHLGRIELQSEHDHPLFSPLPSIINKL